jgi:hypothetical protein
MSLAFGMTAVMHGENVCAKTTGSVKTAYQNFMGKNKTISVDYINGYDFDNAQTGQFKTKAKKISLKKYTHYVFQDLNKDGVAELLVSNQRRSKEGCNTLLICTYKDGKVQPVLCIAGIRNGLYNAKGNKLCVRFGASDNDTYTFLKFNGTQMKHINTFRHEYYHVSGAKMVHNYYKNDKKVSKSSFKKAKTAVTSKINL